MNQAIKEFRSRYPELDELARALLSSAGSSSDVMDESQEQAEARRREFESYIELRISESPHSWRYAEAARTRGPGGHWEGPSHSAAPHDNISCQWRDDCTYGPSKGSASGSCVSY